MNVCARWALLLGFACTITGYAANAQAQTSTSIFGNGATTASISNFDGLNFTITGCTFTPVSGGSAACGSADVQMVAA